MRFCDSPFWDSRLTWYTSNPRFTPCFEATALSWLPLAFLAAGVIDLVAISNSKTQKPFKSSFTFVHASKSILTVALILIQASTFLRMMLQIHPMEEIYVSDWITPLLQILGYICIFLMCIFTKRSGIASSGCQFFFWLCSFLANAVLFYSVLGYSDVSGKPTRTDVIHLSRILSFPIICLRFLLELLNDNSGQDHSADQNPSPDKTSTFFSKLFFLWYDSLAWAGYKRTLTEKDLWDLNAQDRSHVLSKAFWKSWNEQIDKASQKSNCGTKKPPGILNSLWKSNGGTFTFGILLRVASDTMAFVQPAILRLLVAHVTSKFEPSWKGYLYVAVITFTSCCQSMVSSSANKRAYLTAIRVRSTLSNAVFRKSLKISCASRKGCSIGSIVNLQAVDSQKLADSLPMLITSAGSCCQIVIASYLLYNDLGLSSFLGIGILLIVIPFTVSLTAVSRRFHGAQMKLKDERIKLTSELVSGIKVLKLYAWEKPYSQRIEEIRGKELVYLKKIAILSTFIAGMNQLAPALVTLATFAAYVLSDPSNVLNAEKTFVALSLFSIMRNALILIPIAFADGAEALVSVKRLNNFLNMEELDSNAVTHEENYNYPIVMKDLTAYWNPDRITLKNINFSVKPGGLVAIVGKTGCGKSSLLHALLGNLHKLNGIVNVNGTVSYVSQTAWIQNASLRDNILFLDEHNEQKYERIVESCALKPDLDQLPDGDETEIGENGINLSGGQKQRVAIARAAYKDSSIYLFDDPLSAVDANVGKHIFENVIGPNGLLNTKTRVLVTHGISFLPSMDRIFVMKDGEISESGTYNELLARKGEFSEFLLEHLAKQTNEGEPYEDVVTSQPPEQTARRKSAVSVSRRRTISTDTGETTLPDETKLIQRETVVVGNVKRNTVAAFFKSAGLCISICALVLNIGNNVAATSGNIWLSQWSSAATLEKMTTGKVLQQHTTWYLAGYGIIAIVQAMFAFTSTLVTNLMCLAASKTLHSQALSRVIRAPMSYFDTTLTGRLINRFSKDIDAIDTIIPKNLRVSIIVFLAVLATFAIISYTCPYFIVTLIPIVIFYTLLQRFYVATSRQLKRLEGVTRSPIYSHFGETVSGSSVIRAFGLQKQFIAESERKVDLNLMTYFPYALSNMWIGLRLELTGALVVMVTGIFILLSRDTISPGYAGLVLVYAFQIVLMLSLLARQLSDLESNIVSVERVEELTHVPQEAPWETNNSETSMSWPDKGQVRFENYATKYREGLDLVLKGISCTIQPGEKVGVVGRTGAGKSSMTLGLFRLIEAAGGRICIDGVNISALGLHDLRKKITIIPQDPIIFSGTLRKNLDPFDEYSDEKVWTCLELAHLKPHVTSLNGQLHYILEGDGNNLSVGQRQLICLARALLRKTRILILDEATAAVDLETDELIQTTIRKEFNDATVITIAHRLHTVLDSDRILVLDNGEVKEFDSPTNLLRNGNSAFTKMAKDAKII